MNDLPAEPLLLLNAGATLFMTGLIWLSTALLQVPLHRALLPGFDPAKIHRLVRSNWLRTVAWTLRSGIALWLIRPEAWA